MLHHDYWAFGFNKFCRREEAMLVHIITTFGLRKAGLTWVDDFYDARAAFNSPEHEEFEQANHNVAKKEDEQLLNERFECQLCEAHGCDGKKVLHPLRGTFKETQVHVSNLPRLTTQ